jgi:hypothetical protein
VRPLRALLLRDRNDEVAAQRRRWTFYETITIPSLISTLERTG